MENRDLTPGSSHSTDVPNRNDQSSAVWERLTIEPDLAMLQLGPDRTIRNWGALAHRILGWKSEEVLGKSVKMLFLDEDHPGLTERLLQPDTAPHGKWRVRLRARDGNAVPCGVRVLAPGADDPAARPEAPVILFTDRRGVEAAERWVRWSRGLLGVLGVSTIVVDPGGRIQELGDGWPGPEGQVAGRDWVGKHLAELFRSDRRGVLAALREVARNGDWSGDFMVNDEACSVMLHGVRDANGNLEAIVGARRRPEGREASDLVRRMPVATILTDASGCILDTNQELALICGEGVLPDDPVGLGIRSLEIFQTRSSQSALDDAFANGEVDTMDVQVCAGDRPTVLVHLRGHRLSSHDSGTFVFTLVNRAGGADLERQLLHAHKMESIGNFANGLAHDFGNFVSVILGKAAMLRAKLPTEAHITNDLDDIETAAKRAQHLSQELMRFARVGRGKGERLDVNGLIREVGALIRTSIGKRIELDLRLDDAVPIVHGDEVELQQLILNLCLNARDAMPDGGRLTIETGPLTSEQGQELGATNESVEGLCLRVSDTGVGMPPEIVEHVFEPFFTTKRDSQKGTGLGLAMVYGIVRRHRGRIDVRSQENVGTTFEMLLPAAPTEQERPPGKAILVVDDERAFREMIQMILEEDGHEVELAANGIEGLRTVRDRYKELALVIVDLHMPGLDGLGLVAEIRALTKDLPVLVTTGYADDADKKEALRRGAQLVLEKPYRVSDLRAALVKVWEGQTNAATGAE